MPSVKGVVEAESWMDYIDAIFSKIYNGQRRWEGRKEGRQSKYHVTSELDTHDKCALRDAQDAKQTRQTTTRNPNNEEKTPGEREKKKKRKKKATQLTL